jgi:hypothetical protein
MKQLSLGGLLLGENTQDWSGSRSESMVTPGMPRWSMRLTSWQFRYPEEQPRSSVLAKATTNALKRGTHLSAERE